MRMIFRYCFAALAASILTACDQGAGTKLAVLDLDAVAAATGQTQVFEQQITQADRELVAQLQDFAAELDTGLREKRQALGSMQTNEQQQTLIQATQQANLELKQSQALAQNKLQQYRVTIVSQWRERVKPIAEGVAAVNGARMIVTPSSTLFWYDGALDITDAVIEELKDAPLEVTSVPAS